MRMSDLSFRINNENHPLHLSRTTTEFPEITKLTVLEGLVYFSVVNPLPSFFFQNIVKALCL
uniref:Uncharacterized protein n=1 Tax=Megaselia scalaris TaxID=36166 RepID=T1GK20_MEGSC